MSRVSTPLDEKFIQNHSALHLRYRKQFRNECTFCGILISLLMKNSRAPLVLRKCSTEFSITKVEQLLGPTDRSQREHLGSVRGALPETGIELRDSRTP